MTVYNFDDGQLDFDFDSTEPSVFRITVRPREGHAGTFAEAEFRAGHDEDHMWSVTTWGKTEGDALKALLDELRQRYTPKPNRVAVEVYKGRVVNVMAERPSPSEIVVTVLNYDAPIVATDDSGREHLTVLQDVWGTDDRPIKQLNAVNVEPEEEA